MAISTEAGFTATLTRGNVFALLSTGKTFARGEPIPVTFAEMAYLQEHAVDMVARPDDREEGEAMPHAAICKFKFEPVVV